jgi:hypothetical protein
VSRWMVRPLTPNRSARTCGRFWLFPPRLGDALRPSAGLAGRLDQARRGGPAATSPTFTNAAVATAARESLAAAGAGRGCAGTLDGDGWIRQPSRSRSSSWTALPPSCTPMTYWTNTATLAVVHPSLPKPCAAAPIGKACSIAGSWLSGTAGGRPILRFRNAGAPPDRHRACHSVAVCLATCSSLATVAAERPSANSSLARSRTASSLARCLAHSAPWRDGPPPTASGCQVDAGFVAWSSAGHGYPVDDQGAAGAVATELASTPAGTA